MHEVSKQRVRLANAVLNSETMKDAALGGRSAGFEIKEESFSDRQAAALEIEEVGLGHEEKEREARDSHEDGGKKTHRHFFVFSCFFHSKVSPERAKRVLTGTRILERKTAFQLKNDFIFIFSTCRAPHVKAAIEDAYYRNKKTGIQARALTVFRGAPPHSPP